MNLPNILTLSRIVMIPIFVIAYYLPVDWNYLACGLVFTIAGATDMLDGYLARKLNLATPFGAFLDPVADNQSVWVTVPSMIIIGREIVVSALREWMAERKKRDNVAVSNMGKLKTACQMWAILFLLLGIPDDWRFIAGIILIYIAAGLTIWSMYLYLTASWEHLFAEEK